MTRLREIGVRFYQLSFSEKSEIAGRLKLLEEEDMNQPDFERFRRIFLRAHSRGQLEELAKAITATGKIKGFHQYHPNDSWDWDEVSPPILVDYQHNGKTIKGLIDVASDGYMWMLERSGDNINFVDGKPFVKQNVFGKLDPETGRPEINPAVAAPATAQTPSYTPPPNWDAAPKHPGPGGANTFICADWLSKHAARFNEPGGPGGRDPVTNIYGPTATRGHFGAMNVGCFLTLRHRVGPPETGWFTLGEAPSWTSGP